MEPFFFRESDKPLFGLYYPPQGTHHRGCGIVLCYPMGQEYISSHRSFRQLATRLSKYGFPVLRFDYYGSGDSSGDSQEGHPEQWLVDIASAITELKQRSGVHKVCLIGLRLGGSLTMLTGAERDDIQGLVLWDPIVSGTAFLQELYAVHVEEFGSLLGKPDFDPNVDQDTELLGFPLSSLQLSALKNIDLHTIQHSRTKKVLFIESPHTPKTNGFKAHLTQVGCSVNYQHIPSPAAWTRKDVFSKSLVPSLILQSVLSWTSENFA